MTVLCRYCGTLLHPVIMAEGHENHPTCGPEFRRLDAADKARRRVVTATAGARPVAACGSEVPSVATGPEINIGRNHPQSSHTMARLLKGIRLDILRALRAHGPLTDYELENMLRRSHQSISGGRRRCAIDALVEDTGKRRQNRFGNSVIVWTITPRGIAASGG
ncbi:hypothetical protein GCM10029976_090580 [Kribbella albertanoniae]|uniref:Uncharacterized protein n=1 Tax=Kribbella albertanoniae TaxID=1266829 RepID=A0A4V6PAA5_9ACTN|nr:hypothetical protein [Kribbella albertanoniae]TDC22505.1 hypothetical protein E1261_30815 [Kribbella albertanoniae]